MAFCLPGDFFKQNIASCMHFSEFNDGFDSTARCLGAFMFDKWLLNILRRRRLTQLLVPKAMLPPKFKILGPYFFSPPRRSAPPHPQDQVSAYDEILRRITVQWGADRDLLCLRTIIICITNLQFA